MRETLSRRQLDILDVMRRLAVERPSGEIGVAEVAQALYGNELDPAAQYALVQADVMQLAERGLVEQCPSLHEWRLVSNGVRQAAMPE